MLAGACSSGPPGPEQVTHSEAVANGSFAPWTELSLVLYAAGGRLATVSVPLSAYQAAGAGTFGDDANALQLQPGDSDASADVTCSDNAGAPCRAVIVVPTQADLTITFHEGLDPYNYPVSATGASCDAKQSVWNDFIATARDPKASIDIACHIRVAGAVTVKGQWRSGRGDYCWDQPGNAPSPGPGTMWVFSVADYPASPPPYPNTTNVPPCANLPAMDPLVTQVGAAGQ